MVVLDHHFVREPGAVQATTAREDREKIETAKAGSRLPGARRPSRVVIRTAYAHALIETNDMSVNDEAIAQLQQALRIEERAPFSWRRRISCATRAWWRFHRATPRGYSS